MVNYITMDHIPVMSSLSLAAMLFMSHVTSALNVIKLILSYLHSLYHTINTLFPLSFFACILSMYLILLMTVLSILLGLLTLILFFSISNIYFYTRRITSISAIVNSFFVNYDDLYFDMDKTDTHSILNKIDLFLKTRGHFNHSYFNKMKFHFMKKLNDT